MPAADLGLLCVRNAPLHSPLQELEELTELFDRLTAEHEALQQSFKALKEELSGVVGTQAELLKDNTAASALLQEKLKAAEVGVACTSKILLLP